MLDILIIEDDLFSKYKIQQIVESQGWNVIGFAENLDKAIELLNSKSPDLVISDIMLGTNNIFEIFEKESFKKFPFVFITSSEDVVNYAKSKELGNCGFVMKPIHEFTLLSSINLVLKDSKINKTQMPKGIIVKGIFNDKILLKLDSINYLSAQGNYCLINTNNQTFALKKSLLKLSTELDENFIQVHRAYFVNKSKIEYLDLKNSNIIINGKAIPIGKKYENTFSYIFGENNTTQLI